MITFALIDVIIILVYLVFIVAIGLGFWGARGSDAAEYLVAGRTVSLPAFVATVVATWYGGILGTGEFSYSYGLLNWLALGGFYYVFAIVFALFLADKVRSASLYTIPDRFAQYYGRIPALLASGLAFVMVSPAPYVLMLGVLIQAVAGWPLWISVAIGTVLSTFYVAHGGLRTDIRVNIFQFALMFAGFGILLPLAYSHFGGMDYLRVNLPETHLTITGGQSTMYVVVWFFIAIWTLVDPGFHQRCYAAKSGKVASRGILISVCFWFVFDFLTTFSGLYARAALPELADPKMSYLALAELILPPILKGFFFVGILATIMSTVLSYTFLGAVTIGRDVIWRVRGETTEENLRAYTRIGLQATGVLAVILSLAIPSVVELWYAIGSICVPGLLAPLLGSYFGRKRMSSGACLLSMLGGFGTSLVWFIGGQMNRVDGWPVYWLNNLEPMLPGLLVSFLILFTGSKSPSTISNKD